MDLAKNALFKSYGVICLSSPPSTVPDELSMNRSDSDGFFLRVCMFTARKRVHALHCACDAVAHTYANIDCECELIAQSFLLLHRLRAHVIFTS